MAWTGSSLAIGLIQYFYSNPNYLVMASNAIIALALNQVEVQPSSTSGSSRMSPTPDPGNAGRERRIPAATPDMELLRHYEPVIRYTQGEQFFPMDVVRYVGQLCGPTIPTVGRVLVKQAD
jgi:hypothetical protein